MELLLEPPADFSILAGEDALFFPMVAMGASGGVLAAAHWATASFVALWKAARGRDHAAALEIWKRLFPWISLFFEEPNPAPIKHYLMKAGLIARAEVRLPLVEPSKGLQARLEELRGEP